VTSSHGVNGLPLAHKKRLSENGKPTVLYFGYEN